MFQRDIFKTAHTTEQIVYSFEFIQIFSTVISFFGNIDRNFCGSNLNTCANRKIIKRYVNMNGKAVKNDFHLPRNMSSKYARIIELIQDSNISKSSHWFILLHKFSLHIPLFNFYIFLTYNFLFLIRLQNVLFFAEPSIIHIILLNRTFRILLALGIFCMLVPLLDYLYFYYTDVAEYKIDDSGICSHPYIYQIPCGNGEVRKLEKSV